MKIFKRFLSILLRVAISIALLVILFHFKKIDTRSLLNDIKAADKPLLFLAFFVFLLIYILCFIRWHMLLKAANIHLSKRRVLISFSGGIFFSLFLPSSIGGDVARSIDLGRHTKKPGEVAATVLLDRISGYVGLAGLLLFSLLAGFSLVRNNALVLTSVAVIVTILVTVLLVIFNKFCFTQISRFLKAPNAGRIRELLTGLYQEAHYFKKRKGVLVKNLIVSAAIQALGPLTFYITALSLGVSGINLLYFLIFIPIIGAITLLPISIGGFGLRENISVILFAKAGVSESSAAAMALLSSFFILVCGVIGGLIYVFTLHHRRLQYHKSSSGEPRA